MKKLLPALGIFFMASAFSMAQCPDNMYFFGAGASYFFYNDSANPDICTTSPPATVTVYDATAFCGPATFTAGAACLPVGASFPPVLGQSYAQNDPLCSDPQIITPLVVTWGPYTCTYDGTAGSPYLLISQAEPCPSNLDIPDNPIPDGTYTAGEAITSTGKVPINGSVIFSAGTQICLDAGFEVALNGDFEALIEGCQ